MTHTGGNNAAGKCDEVNDGLKQRVWNWGIKSLINFLRDCQHRAVLHPAPMPSVRCSLVHSWAMIVKHEGGRSQSAQHKVL